MGEQQPATDESSQPPRVFISYSDDSASHAARVLELAQWLRSEGIDAQLDQFEDSPEEGWPRWIYRQIRESDFVLLICTPDYLRRCEGEQPRAGGADKAVKFESHLSLQELHDAEGRNRKFVPVLLDDADVGECVPLPLRGATHYRLPKQREDLYRRLSAQPRVKPVAVAALRTLDDDSLASQLRARLNETREITAESSVVEPLVLARSEQPRSHRQRLITVGAFGVGVLAVALFVNHAVNGEDELGAPKCSIQLSEPAGGTIDDIDAVVLELPAGQTIAVTVEGGNTLVFECPAVAVNAHLTVQRRNVSETVSDAPPSSYTELETFDSEIAISPTPGLQTIELPALRPAPTPDAVPTPELPPELPPPVNDTGDGDGESSDPPPDQPAVEPSATSPRSPRGGSSGGGSLGGSLGPLVLGHTAHADLQGLFDRNQSSLVDCYRQRLGQEPQLAGKLELELELTATGDVDAVHSSSTPFDERLLTCVSKQIESWRLSVNRGSLGKVTGGAVPLELEFAPTFRPGDDPGGE